MRTTPAKLCGVALAFLMATSTVARADLVHWSYSWSRSPSEVMADPPGTSSISLTDESLQQVVGNSDIVSTNLRTNSTAPDAKPDHFTAKPYVLSLTLTDEASGASGTLNFSGVFDGTVSAHSANITSTFTGPISQSIQLGEALYTVTLPYYTPPGPPTSATDAVGSISAHVTVEMLPEPQSLFLGGFGVMLIGLLWKRDMWRRPPRPLAI